MRDLLDRLLDAAPDLDTALDLAERLGWHLYMVDGKQSLGFHFFVMLIGPDQPHLTATQTPQVITGPLYSNAGFRSLYGAILLALVRGLAWARECEVRVASFKHKAA